MTVTSTSPVGAVVGDTYQVTPPEARPATRSGSASTRLHGRLLGGPGRAGHLQPHQPHQQDAFFFFLFLVWLGVCSDRSAHAAGYGTRPSRLPAARRTASPTGPGPRSGPAAASLLGVGLRPPAPGAAGRPWPGPRPGTAGADQVVGWCVGVARPESGIRAGGGAVRSVRGPGLAAHG